MTRTRMVPASAVRHLRLSRSLAIAGYVGIAAFLGTVGVWAIATPLNGAVVAPATFVTENNLRRIRHAQGGVVSELMVREGDRVKSGDVLLRLDGTVAQSTLDIIVQQLEEALARVARLEAERDRLPAPRIPDVFVAHGSTPRVARLLASEAEIQKARATARDGTRAQLTMRIAQLRSEIMGLKRQEDARIREFALNAEELEGVRTLYNKGLTPISRLAGLERNGVQLDGAQGALRAQIAQAEGKIAETEIQILQIEKDWLNEVLKELREWSARAAELSERHKAAEDQRRRLDIRAPVDGVVHQLAVSSAGTVISPGEAAMAIVPVDEELHLDARIAPSEFDQISVGQSVVVRIQAFDQRAASDIHGVVTRLAADTTRDGPNGPPFYSVRISIPSKGPDGRANLAIRSGMQADVFVQTSERTPASYMLKPLADQFARAFRER
jgi:HlyD family secretion protein